MPVPNYASANIPPGAFNAPPITSHLNTELYHGDPSALDQVNQSKKVGIHFFVLIYIDTIIQQVLLSSGCTKCMFQV
jgi:hypothetical protein